MPHNVHTALTKEEKNNITSVFVSDFTKGREQLNLYESGGTSYTYKKYLTETLFVHSVNSTYRVMCDPIKSLTNDDYYCCRSDQEKYTGECTCDPCTLISEYEQASSITMRPHLYNIL